MVLISPFYSLSLLLFCCTLWLGYLLLVLPFSYFHYHSPWSPTPNSHDLTHSFSIPILVYPVSAYVLPHSFPSTPDYDSNLFVGTLDFL